jgi:hypothetical protein
VLKSGAHASILPDGDDHVREESGESRVESQRSHSRGGGNPGFDDGREKLALTKVVAQEGTKNRARKEHGFCRPLRDADKNTGGKVLLDYMYLSPFS